MLTHPNGHFMAIEAISGLMLDAFERVYFVYLHEHEERYNFLKGFREELEEVGLSARACLIDLPEATQDQPETVYQAISKANIRGPIFIKDADNRFGVRALSHNHVCYADLNTCGLIKPQNKSYLMKNDFGHVVNIVEKQVISPFFCVGGYGFGDAARFCGALERLDRAHERYISQVIYQLLLEKESFEAVPAEDYLDWGTITDWNRFRRSHGTLFIDLDGVLVKHSASHFPPYYGDTGCLEDNVAVVNELKASGKFQVVITTARPKQFRDVTVEQLTRLNIHYDELLMGMNHAKRIVINDYSRSKAYKSCDAINLKRNAEDLRETLREALGVVYEEI
jgi:hypothetical protein